MIFSNSVSHQGDLLSALCSLTCMFGYGALVVIMLTLLETHNGSAPVDQEKEEDKDGDDHEVRI